MKDMDFANGLLLFRPCSWMLKQEIETVLMWQIQSICKSLLEDNSVQFKTSESHWGCRGNCTPS